MKELSFTESAGFKYCPAETEAKNIILNLEGVRKNIKLLIIERLKPFEPQKQLGIARAVRDYCEGSGHTTSSSDEIINELLQEFYHLIDNPMLIHGYGKKGEPIHSTELPLNFQYQENWGWEGYLQCYELDTEFKDKHYFQSMDPEDICRLVRKMDNFLMERGISYQFLRNYEHVLRAYQD